MPLVALRISIQCVGQNGLTWARWQRLAEMVEALGFDGLYCADHFMPAAPPDREALDAIVAFTWLASHTRRIRFGPLVSPLTFRHPVLLARQAAAIDDLSGGRMVVGLGSGWMQREHHAFGFALGGVSERADRFAEGVEVMARLLREEEPVTFAGRYFALEQARLQPRPARPGGPRLMVGGNGRLRTLPLAARWADAWNGIWLGPVEYRRRVEQIEALLRAEGRDRAAFPCTLDTALYLGRDRAELERRLAPVRAGDAALADLPLELLTARLHAERGFVVGTPPEAVERLRALGAAGADEVMLQLFDLDDLDQVRLLAETVLPRMGA